MCLRNVPWGAGPDVETSYPGEGSLRSNISMPKIGAMAATTPNKMGATNFVEANAVE